MGYFLAKTENTDRDIPQMVTFTQSTQKLLKLTHRDDKEQRG